MLGETLLQWKGGGGGAWFTQLANTMDHASYLTCLTPSSSLCMVQTTHTGAPCNPSDSLLLPVTLPPLLSQFVQTCYDWYNTYPWIHFTNYECRRCYSQSSEATVKRIDSTLWWCFFLVSHTTTVCASLNLSPSSTFPCAQSTDPWPLSHPSCFLSREALTSITSTVTHSLSNDLNTDMEAQCFNTKAPQAFPPALSATSVVRP